MEWKQMENKYQKVAKMERKLKQKQKEIRRKTNTKYCKNSKKKETKTEQKLKRKQIQKRSKIRKITEDKNKHKNVAKYRKKTEGKIGCTANRRRPSKVLKSFCATFSSDKFFLHFYFWERCYDFLTFSPENFGKNIGVFCSKKC
jgi:hypothetical protein